VTGGGDRRGEEEDRGEVARAPLMVGFGSFNTFSYLDGFCEAGETMSIALSMYDLDKIKKWDSRNLCPYYLIHRVINRQVDVDCVEDDGDCGGGGGE
jgi:hypothetical protein